MKISIENGKVCVTASNDAEGTKLINYVHGYSERVTPTVTVPRKTRGRRKASVRMTEEQKQEARALRVQGWSYGALARRYNVAHSSLWMIINKPATQ